MSIRIALAGNPNSGKTTLFNALTGSNQFVGNWPGVTVEKKEGKLKRHKDVIVMDLPGIYSLSPYTLEEVISRNYLIEERPDVILNIVDGTNLERNLFLTTQLTELGIPVVVAVNMMDAVKKNGIIINFENLSKMLGCKVVPISALKGDGVMEAADAAIQMANGGKTVPQHGFSGSVEHAIAHIEEAVLHSMPEEQQRWYAIKLFERDSKIIEKLKLNKVVLDHIEGDIKNCENELGDDSASIITTERYAYIDSTMKGCCQINNKWKLSTSDKIDRIVTNRFLALPIFALVMILIYTISVTTVGSLATDWANDGVFGDGWHLFGIGAAEYEEAKSVYEAEVEKLEGFTNSAEEHNPVNKTIEPEGSQINADEPDPASYGIWIPGIPVLITGVLESVECAEWLQGLIIDGIVAGVGAVLGFVPQLLILFLFLAFIEGCGYMARIAFILDRMFRRFGLSGKSFIPILIGTGCGVPGIMASRTIENERDRKMTIITTTFIPCSAKLPIIALFAGALFGGAWWVAPGSYFIGIAAIICTGIILKKTSMFAGDAVPFVMELPAYHLPTIGSVFRSMWERAWSFIKKAGTIILLATVFIWFSSNFGWTDGSLGMTDMDESILAAIGNSVAWIFAPLGWGDWKAAVAAITGLIAKENIVGTFGILFGFAEVAEDGVEVWGNLAASFTMLSAYSFLVFNLLCAPCFAAMGAIKREMNNAKWFWFAVGYQCVLAYIVSFCVYQLGMLFTAGSFTIGAAVALLLVIIFAWLLFRKQQYQEAWSI